MLVAHDQSAKVEQPSHGSLDFPAATISTQRASVLPLRFATIAAMRTDQLNAPFRQALSQGIGVGCLIVDQPLRVPSWSASSGPRDADFLQGRFNQRDFVGRRRGKFDSKRHTFAIRHHHKLCTLAAFGFADRRPPFFAGTNVPSAKTSCQLSWPRSSSSAKNARQAFSQTSLSSQPCNRLQQVLAEGYPLGKSFQRAPLRNTHKIPSKQWRLAIGSCPPFAERRGSGKNRAILTHCSSVSSGLYCGTYLAIETTPFDGHYNETPYFEKG